MKVTTSFRVFGFIAIFLVVLFPFRKELNWCVGMMCSLDQMEMSHADTEKMHLGAAPTSDAHACCNDMPMHSDEDVPLTTGDMSWCDCNDALSFTKQDAVVSLAQEVSSPPPAAFIYKIELPKPTQISGCDAHHSPPPTPPTSQVLSETQQFLN